MKALRNLGFHGKVDNVHEQSGTVQFFINTSPTSGRPRTRSSTTIWNLPDSVIVTILRGVHIKDLLSFKSVHSYFCDIVDSNQNSLWKSVSFFDCWPEEANLHHFVKASEFGNVEATIKLAVAYLYKEGLTKDDVSKIASEAATYLSLAESLTQDTFPFFWIFIRPPWAPDGSCCKVQAFNHLKGLVDKNKDRDLAFGIALTLKLQRLSVQGVSKSEEQKYFDLAAKQNSSAAIFFSLLDVIPSEVDTGQEFERIRLLRQLSTANILEAKVNLVRSYIQGHYGGITEAMAKEYSKQFFRSSNPSGIHSTFSKGPTSDISRYILVDWLVEVVGMKDFSAHTLYLAVSLFDRFLKMRSVQRSKVQLLGVASMVVSSRFLGFDILTIREAAWLTDNSYTYHDVVRMMGELVATLSGNIRVVTIQDFVKTLLVVTGEGGYMAMLVEYIAMLCLLQSEMGQYSPAEVAASCVLLSRLLLNKDDPWPDRLKDWTGYTQDYLSLCTFHIHKKCLLEGSEVDYRDTKLRAVKLRYADSNRCSVSNIEVIGHRELCRRLGVTRLVNHGKNTKSIRFRNTDELIVSPRRGKKRPEFLRSLSKSFDDDNAVDRTNAATPPIKHPHVLEDNVSGYDGDFEEDSDECMSEKSDMLYELTGDSDLDHSTTFDHYDESHDWDSEASLMEDEPSDKENDSSLCDRSGMEGAGGKIECLSSMCHSGNNVNCQASTSSPSCCISNCSCQQTFTFAGGFNSKRGTLTGALSSRSLRCARISSSSTSSSSSLLSPLSSPTLSSSKYLPLVQQSAISLSTSSPHTMNDNLAENNENNRKTSRRSRSSSLSASTSTSICDTPTSSNCDENGNRAQPFVSSSSSSYGAALADTNRKYSCSIVNNVDCTDKQQLQGSEFQKSYVMSVKKSSSSVSSFIEISCSSTSSDLNAKSESVNVNDFVSAGLGGAFAISDKSPPTSTVWQRSNLSFHFDNGTDRSSSSSSLCNLNEIPCCSKPECMHEISSTPTSSLDSCSVQKYFTHSSSIRFYTNPSESESSSSKSLSETPSSHFMSTKRARLEQSSSFPASPSSSFTSPVSHCRVSSRSCCNSFTDLLGRSKSHQPSDDGGQYFTLPSRLKRKKTSCQ